MIDTDKYEIDDDVVWVWNDSDDAYDEEKKKWVYGAEHANWQLWEYKKCPPEKGGTQHIVKVKMMKIHMSRGINCYLPFLQSNGIRRWKPSWMCRFS